MVPWVWPGTTRHSWEQPNPRHHQEVVQDPLRPETPREDPRAGSGQEQQGILGNNQTHGTIKRSSKIRSSPYRSSIAPSSQLWFLEVPTRCGLWFLGHPLREICPDHHSLSTGSKGRGRSSEAGGAHLDPDQCLRPSQFVALAVWNQQVL